jgi:oxepin-CoA hydrolase / 3-oxo-5,6-dehydrosuberyl-CoA semialdehyde dehydrogenase
MDLDSQGAPHLVFGEHMVSNLLVPFTPGDRHFRIHFLRNTVSEALTSLKADQPPTWGRMTSLQMVEHLIWTFRASTNQVSVTCNVPEERRNQVRPFIFNEQQNPRNFQLPNHQEGLPPSQFSSLDHAIAALKSEISHFLERYLQDPNSLSIHPVLGSITSDEWSRLHFKHCFHHLMQFSLLAERPPQPV